MAKTTKEYFDIKADMYFALRNNIVYYWMRKGEPAPLYIGKSTQGLDRPLSVRHEIVNSYHPFKDNDWLRVYPMPDEATMNREEQERIHSINPAWNVQFSHRSERLEIEIKCDRCGHWFTKHHWGVDDCTGNCKGGDECLCQLYRQKEELMDKIRAIERKSRINWLPKKKPTGVGSLDDKPVEKRPDGVGTLIR